LTSIARKNIFEGNINKISLAGNSIRDIKARINIIAGIDIIITT
jgi:hypothetical protein